MHIALSELFADAKGPAKKALLKGLNQLRDSQAVATFSDLAWLDQARLSPLDYVLPKALRQAFNGPSMLTPRQGVRALLILLLVLTPWWLVNDAVSQQKTVHQLLTQGLSALRSEQFDQAERAYRTVNTLDKNNELAAKGLAYSEQAKLKSNQEIAQITEQGVNVQTYAAASDIKNRQPYTLENSPLKRGTVYQDTLKDGSLGPKMVRIPAGSFNMGDLQGTGVKDEKPVHRVTINKAFAVSQYEITFDDYQKYTQDQGLPLPDDYSWGIGWRPVINVSWEDTQGYIQWLNQQTGKRYRLLSEAEWEYAARAGIKTYYYWGDLIGQNQANCNGCGSQWDLQKTAPVGSFAANAFRLYDMHGNVWEWVEDHYHDSYEGAPSDGSAWVDENDSNSFRVVRGGSWINLPEWLRASARSGNLPMARHYALGFRLAQDTMAPAID